MFISMRISCQLGYTEDQSQLHIFISEELFCYFFFHNQVLNLKENLLEEIPPQLYSLSKLCGLDLSNNTLSDVPEEVSHMTSLRELDLSNNNFLEFPKFVCAVPNLEILRFDQTNGSKIVNLPDEISTCKAKELVLSNNMLQTLPKAISGMTNLTHLYLSNNEITVLPETICDMQSLQLLHLNGNCLVTLPRAFDQLIFLRDLRLYDNKMKVPPSDVCDSGVMQPIGLFLRKAFKREGEKPDILFL